MSSFKKSFCKKQKTVSFELASDYLQSNPYITDGYRRKLAILNCFKSSLIWTNETLNIWTHTVGLFIFIGLLLYDLLIEYNRHLPSISDVCLGTFVLACFMTCMVCSSLYHTLNCHSSEYNELWLSWDIFGISTSFIAVFLSGIYYAFWCDQHIFIRNIYLASVSILFIAAMTYLLHPRFKGIEYQSTRVSLFLGWGISGLLPTFHWAILYKNSQPNMVTEFLPKVFVMYAISGVALLVYLFKIPERFWPGRFNYIASSHQIWHVVIVCALCYWHKAGMEFAIYRYNHGCALKL